MTVLDTYPLPLIREYTDSLRDATILLTNLCNNRYCQIKTSEAARNKNTFSSHHGLFQLARMALVLKTALALPQRALNAILPRDRWQFVLIDIDDILVYLKPFAKLLKHMPTFPALLPNEEVKLESKSALSLESQFRIWGTTSDRKTISGHYKLRSIRQVPAPDKPS